MPRSFVTLLTILAICATAATMMVASVVRSVAVVRDMPNTGEDIYDKCASTDANVARGCGEYLLGVLDGVVAATPPGQLICPENKVSSYFQLEIVYINWAKANHNLLGRNRVLAAAAALSAAFPCPKR